MKKISWNIALDLLKNKVIIIYAVVLSILGWGMLLLESQPEKTILALLQVTLIILPLVTSVIATIYYYNSLEFIHLLLIQPLKRSKIIYGIFIGLSFGFVLSFLVGIGLPLLITYPTEATLYLIISGVMLSIIFTSISLLVSMYQKDKARSMGIILLLWVFFAFIFDGVLLFIMYQLGEYPIEQSILIATFGNPISIGRILVVMHTEASALMGLSGAIFQDFFGSGKGAFLAITALVAWAGIPYLFSRRKFIKRDF